MFNQLKELQLYDLKCSEAYITTFN